MLIFGRSPNLVLGACTAVFNTAVVFHIFGFNPDAAQIGTVNVMFGAIIALIANSDAITVVAGNAARTRSNVRNERRGDPPLDPPA